jgi:hypothetical protein
MEVVLVRVFIGAEGWSILLMLVFMLPWSFGMLFFFTKLYNVIAMGWPHVAVTADGLIYVDRSKCGHSRDDPFRDYTQRLSHTNLMFQEDPINFHIMQYLMSKATA